MKLYILSLFHLVSSYHIHHHQHIHYILLPKSFHSQTNIVNSQFISGVSYPFIFLKNNTRQQDLLQLSHTFYIELNQPVKPTWHLDRINQRSLPLSNTPLNYIVNNTIDMYIIDSGVDISHPEFQFNNPIWGPNYIDNVNTDCHGHGTHVASLAVGKNYGVAKHSNLISLKVLGCNGIGYTSDIIQAISWINNRAKTRQNKLSIVNMSLGGGRSRSLELAIRNSFSQGIYYVIAAGNDNDNACNYSPARASVAITVAASTSTDNKASFSNYGPCIDVYAPGSRLVAAWPNNRYATLSGTSMASPVAAGTLAIYLSKFGKRGYFHFLNNTTKNTIRNNPNFTPNRLVYIR
jgi:serine protease